MSQSLTSVVARPERRVAETAHPPRLRVVTADEARGPLWFPILCLTLLLGGLAAVLGLNTVMAQDSFEVGRLESRTAVLADQQESLTHEIDQASAPQHLADRAAGLGMVPADSPAFVDLHSGEVRGVAEAATRPPNLTVDAAASPRPKAEEESSSPRSSSPHTTPKE